MDPRTEKLIRRTAMVAACTGAYFLLTADFGPEDDVLFQVREARKSVQQSVKKLLSGSQEIKGEDASKEKPRA